MQGRLACFPLLHNQSIIFTEDETNIVLNILVQALILFVYTLEEMAHI